MGQGCLTWCLGQMHTLEPLSYSILFPFLNNRVKVCLGLVTFLHLVFLDLVVLGGERFISDFHFGFISLQQ